MATSDLFFPNYEIMLARVICSFLFHCLFEQELRSGIKNMKYLSWHWNEFENKLQAFAVTFMQSSTVIIIEIILIWNLCTLEDVVSIVQDFTALYIVAEFDDFFLEMFKQTRCKDYLGCELNFTNFGKVKLELLIFDGKYTAGDDGVDEQALKREEAFARVKELNMLVLKSKSPAVFLKEKPKEKKLEVKTDSG